MTECITMGMTQRDGRRNEPGHPTKSRGSSRGGVRRNDRMKDPFWKSLCRSREFANGFRLGIESIARTAFMEWRIIVIGADVINDHMTRISLPVAQGKSVQSTGNSLMRILIVQSSGFTPYIKSNQSGNQQPTIIHKRVDTMIAHRLKGGSNRWLHHHTA